MNNFFPYIMKRKLDRTYKSDGPDKPGTRVREKIVYVQSVFGYLFLSIVSELLIYDFFI